MLSITVSPLGHLFHCLEVVLPPLILHLVDSEFDLRCRILLRFDHLLMQVFLVYFLQSLLAQTLDQDVVGLFAQACYHLLFDVFYVSGHFAHCRFDLNFESC